MVCLAPRAPGDSVRPRRLSGVVVRPLNFTVRSHLGEISVAKSRKRLRLAPRKWQPRLTGSSSRRLRSVHQTCACGLGRAQLWGTLASVAGAVPHAHSGDL